MTDPTPPPSHQPDAVDFTVLGEPRRIHIVAIGGAGMSAIASILAAIGHQVSGSDQAGSVVLDRLRAQGIDARVGHDPAVIEPGIDIVARSTAIGDDNPEVVAARALGIPVWSRADILAAIAATRRTVAVAGTHGKTTTSSMLALVLVEAGLDPSFIIGGDVLELGTGARWGSGDLFVMEADESDGTFVTLSRAASIVTNLEADHLEHWGGFDSLEASFVEFVAGTDGPCVICADDPGALGLAAATNAVTYGTNPDADYRMVDLTSTGDGVSFALVHRSATGDEELGAIALPVPGDHNARNAAAATVTALQVGAPFAAAQAALGRFGGVARRFEQRGAVHGLTFIDSYDHLRTEVRAVLRAARAGDWGRIVCVFQPHRYSRTESLWPTFADAFDLADVLVITSIYASGEAPRPGVTAKLVVDAVLDHDPHRRLVYLPEREDVVAFLARELRPGDLCLTLGAGDLTTVPDSVMERLAGACTRWPTPTPRQRPSRRSRPCSARSPPMTCRSVR
jgi:UDP-N-acetylmuramate--alanine ligase